jgi:hypothetical protein
MALNAEAHIKLSVKYPIFISWMLSWLLVAVVRLHLLTADRAFRLYKQWLLTHVYYSIDGSHWQRVQ